jgi:hypothetical protein
MISTARLCRVSTQITGKPASAQGLGDEDRQASWDEEGDRGAGASLAAPAGIC